MDETKLTRLEQDYYLRALDVDIRGNWMPSAIFVRMQEIAEDHATAVGLGRVDLIDTKGLGWVLTRLNLGMERYPKIGQTIKVATWPLKPTKLLFLRHFMFWDDTGVLGRASSQWVLFDIAERAIRRTATVGDYPYDPNEKGVIEEPGKIMLPSEMDEITTRKVMYSDVDMNRHMNNTKYLNWICELFPTEILQNRSIKNVKINYIAEAAIDQQVSLFTKEADGGWYVVGKTDGKTVFDSFVEWM